MKRGIHLLFALIVMTGIIDAQTKPNVVLIVADDLGYGDLSCYGHKTTSTPNLDSMSSGGLRFTDFHSNGAVCSPTRAAFMTGMYQQRVRVSAVVSAQCPVVNQEGLDTVFITLPEILKKAGYTTGMFGKWHLGYIPKFNPVNQGFDEFRGFVSGNIDFINHIDQKGIEDWWVGTVKTKEAGYATELITKHTLDFIRKNKDTSFFLYVSHGAPHYPYQGPADKGFRKAGTCNKTPLNPSGLKTSEANRYRQMIEYMDMGIGQIIDTLKALGLEKNTLVVFFSDNGPTKPFANKGSTAGLSGHKSTVYEGGHRVPAIAYWPETIEAGRTTGQTVVGMDLFPTIARLAGLTVRGTDGVDVSSLLLAEGDLAERTLVWQHEDQQGGTTTAVRQGRWKLVKIGKNVALYDLDASLVESAANDVAATQPTVKNALLDSMAHWEMEVKAPPAITWSTAAIKRPSRYVTRAVVGKDEACSIELFSLSGKRHLSVVRKGGALESSALASVPAGIYLMRVRAGGHVVQSRRFFHGLDR